jgi:hypothetical protein
MKASVKICSFLVLAVGATTLISCGHSTSSNERTTFTREDSLTETYLSLQDTLLHSWNLLIKDEQEKMDAVNATIHQLKQLSLPNPSQLTSVAGRFEQLKSLHITQKSLSNQYVVEEYDFATNSLISEILFLSESNVDLLQNKELTHLIDKIKSADERTSVYRLSYDSIANEFNAFLEKNQSTLKDINNGKLEKKPLFSAVSNN